jgi:hypothetical protein
MPLKSRDEPVWVLGEILDGLMGLSCDDDDDSPGLLVAEEVDFPLLESIGLRICWCWSDVKCQGLSRHPEHLHDLFPAFWFNTSGGSRWSVCGVCCHRSVHL